MESILLLFLPIAPRVVLNSPTLKFAVSFPQPKNVRFHQVWSSPSVHTLDPEIVTTSS